MRIGWIFILLLLAGCGDPRERHMRDSVDHARAQLHQAQIEPFAANRLRAVMETRGTPIDYVEKADRENSSLGPYRWEKPEQAYDVVISGNPDDWRVDGYGKSLEQPLVSERIQREP